MSVYGPGAVADASPVKGHASNPRSPGRLPGGTRKVSGRTARGVLTGVAARLCVEAVASARHGTRRTNGPGAVTGPGPLLVARLTFDRPANVPPTPPGRPDGVARGPIPVGDATALGTLRTRLETRTKESNMYASHWD